MTAVVLAGGKSRRLKRDKALVKVGGIPLLERVVTTITPLFSDVLIVANEDYPVVTNLGLKRVSDIIPANGPLSGIYTGLKLASTPWVFIFATDLPFLQPPLIKYMCSLINGSAAVIPHVHDRLQPLLALYAKSCLPAIEELLVMKEWQVSCLYSRVSARYVTEEKLRPYDPELISFFNLNNPPELKQAQQIASGVGKTSTPTW